MSPQTISLSMMQFDSGPLMTVESDQSTSLDAGRVVCDVSPIETDMMLSLIVDLASMILHGLEAVVNAILGEDPPKPKIPKAALQQAYEALLISFNAGNVLGRANLYTYSVGDAMLSSAQNHRAQAISLQKQPWMASLGCDACVWTNAPLEIGSNLATVGWEMFKHVITVQASRVLGDCVALSHLALDEMKE